MSSFLFDSLHRGLGQVLDLRQAQHGLTASNLANAETPGYRAKVIPFDKILSNVVNNGANMQMTQSVQGHVGGPGGDINRVDVTEVEPAPWVTDGNSVDAERESVRLSSNSMMYNAVAQGMSRRMAMLRYAASNGRG